MQLDSYEVDGVLIDARKRRIIRDGASTRLTPKAFAVLSLLIERQGQVVSREEFRDTVWQGKVVNDENLTQQISVLRRALGDLTDSPRFIAMVPGRGYAFIAVAKPANSLPTLANAVQSAGRWRRFSPWLLGAIGLLTIFVAFALSRTLFGQHTRPLSERQLTTKPFDDPVTAAALSPDGKYVAYSDRDGVQIQEVDSRRTTAVNVGELSSVSSIVWFSDGSRLLASAVDTHGRSGVWIIRFLNHVARKLRDGVSRSAASPDGEKIAFIDDSGRNVWIMGDDGNNPRLLYSGDEGDRIREIAWSPDGQRILLGKLHLGAFNLNITIEALDEQGRLTTIVKSNPGLRSSCMTADGRLIYAVAEPPPNQNDTSLWEYEHVDWINGHVSAPKLLAKWIGASVRDISVAAQKSRLVFLRGYYQADVYVGELAAPGVLSNGVRRLTSDESNDLPTSWSADSQTVFFHSDRSGKWEIWKQSLRERRAELAVAGFDDYRGARVSADGQWLYYFGRPRTHQIWAWPRSSQLLQMSIEGGPTRILFASRGIYSFRCPQIASQACIIGERSLTNWSKMFFYVLDPELGKGSALSSVAIDAPIDVNYWDVSPDGTEAAVVMKERHGSARIGLFRLTTGLLEQEVTVDGQFGFQSLDWSADGQGWYVSSGSAQGAKILFVDRLGRATVVRDQPGSFGTWAVPSPDGKRVALLEWSTASNAWLVEGF